MSWWAQKGIFVHLGTIGTVMRGDLCVRNHEVLTKTGRPVWRTMEHAMVFGCLGAKCEATRAEAHSVPGTAASSNLATSVMLVA